MSNDKYDTLGVGDQLLHKRTGARYVVTKVSKVKVLFWWLCYISYQKECEGTEYTRSLCSMSGKFLFGKG